MYTYIRLGGPNKKTDEFWLTLRHVIETLYPNIGFWKVHIKLLNMKTLTFYHFEGEKSRESRSENFQPNFGFLFF